jgi:hypothetical protein
VFDANRARVVVISSADVNRATHVSDQDSATEQFVETKLCNVFCGAHFAQDALERVAGEVAAAQGIFLLDAGGSGYESLCEVISQLSRFRLDDERLLTRLVVAVDEHQLLGVADLIDDCFFIGPLSPLAHPPRKIARRIRMRGLLLKFRSLRVIVRGLSKLSTHFVRL